MRSFPNKVFQFTVRIERISYVPLLKILLQRIFGLAAKDNLAAE